VLNNFRLIVCLNSKLKSIENKYKITLLSSGLTIKYPLFEISIEFKFHITLKLILHLRKQMWIK